eukprot:2531364-Pyramimonas_sp.AAC.1
MTRTSGGRWGRSGHPRNALGEAQLLASIPRLENCREPTKRPETSNLEPETSQQYAARRRSRSPKLSPREAR